MGNGAALRRGRIYRVGPQRIREPRGGFVGVPKKPSAPSSHIDKALTLSVDLAENDDYFSQT
jgi:hypothetical protein